MKKQYISLILVTAMMMHIPSMHGMNYVQSAYRQAATTAQNIKEQAQRIKANVQRFGQSLTCVQSTLGCSAEQSMYISNLLNNIDASLMPLRNLPSNIASKLQKPVEFIQNKVHELQTYVAQGLDRLTKEQKEAFISGAKRMAVAAAVIITAIAIVAIGKAVMGGEQPAMSSDDQKFINAVRNKYIPTVRSYLISGTPSLGALKAAQAVMAADASYPRDLVTDIKLAIHKRTAFPEVYEQEYLGQPGDPDHDFAMYAIQRNVRVVEDWLEQDLPTLRGLKTVEKIIADDATYPKRSALLSKIRQTINSKQFAKEFRKSLGR